MIVFVVVVVGLILLTGLCTLTGAAYDYEAEVRALLGDLPQAGGES